MQPHFAGLIANPNWEMPPSPHDSFLHTEPEQRMGGMFFLNTNLALNLDKKSNQMFKTFISAL